MSTSHNVESPGGVSVSIFLDQVAGGLWTHLRRIILIWGSTFCRQCPALYRGNKSSWVCTASRHPRWWCDELSLPPASLAFLRPWAATWKCKSNNPFPPRCCFFYRAFYQGSENRKEDLNRLNKQSNALYVFLLQCLLACFHWSKVVLEDAQWTWNPKGEIPCTIIYKRESIFWVTNFPRDPRVGSE